jgi:hypothetical protein
LRALDGDSFADQNRAVGIRLCSFRVAVLGAALTAALAGCVYFPEPVQGLPGGGGWVALPLRGWIAESGVKAEGIAGCFAADCAPRVGVGIFRAVGEEARIVAAVLREPERLVRFIEGRDRADTAPQRKGVRTVATVEKLRAAGLSGFAATLSREDGTRVAHAAVLAAETREGMRFALVVGESREGVRMMAREVAGKLR